MPRPLPNPKPAPVYKNWGKSKNSLKSLGEIKDMLMLIAMTLKYDQMVAHVYGIQPQESFRVAENRLETPSSSHLIFEPLQSKSSLAFGTRYAKINFPRFYGEDPMGWFMVKTFPIF